MMIKINIALILVLFLITGVAFADSTNYSIEEPSGLTVFIDAATGCHYIGRTSGGGIIPRVNERGDHICGGEVMEYQLLHKAEYNAQVRAKQKRTFDIKVMEERSR